MPRNVIAMSSGDGQTLASAYTVRCSVSPGTGVALVQGAAFHGHTTCTRNGPEEGAPRRRGRVRPGRGGERGMTDGSHGITRLERTCSLQRGARVTVLL